MSILCWKNTLKAVNNIEMLNWKIWILNQGWQRQEWLFGRAWNETTNFDFDYTNIPLYLTKNMKKIKAVCGVVDLLQNYPTNRPPGRLLRLLIPLACSFFAKRTQQLPKFFGTTKDNNNPLTLETRQNFRLFAMSWTSKKIMAIMPTSQKDTQTTVPLQCTNWSTTSKCKKYCL